jgi:hypothetical protein
MATQANYRNNGAISKKKASTAYKVGDFLTTDSNGFLVPAGGVAGKLVGISNEEITASSSDYASTRDLNVSGGGSQVEFEIPVITGSATQTLVGELVDIDASDSRGVDVTASTNDQILVTRIIDSATIKGKIVL